MLNSTLAAWQTEKALSGATDVSSESDMELVSARWFLIGKGIVSLIYVNVLTLRRSVSSRNREVQRRPVSLIFIVGRSTMPPSHQPMTVTDSTAIGADRRNPTL